MMEDSGNKLGFDRTARILHWLSAAFFIAALVIGLYFATLDYRNNKADYALFAEWIYWHKTFGVLVFVLVFYRLYHRYKSPPPPMPAASPRWMHLASGASHVSLYALILILPLTGLIASDIGNYPVKLFELIPIPQFPAENRPLADEILKVHMYIGDIAAGIVALHIGASLYHHFICKDNILTRMLNGR